LREQSEPISGDQEKEFTSLRRLILSFQRDHSAQMELRCRHPTPNPLAFLAPREPGTRITGVYEHAITTPSGKMAVIRREDTFTLAPWRPALEPFRGQAVTGVIGPNRVSWT